MKEVSLEIFLCMQEGIDPHKNTHMAHIHCIICNKDASWENCFMSCWQVIGSKFSQRSVTDISCFSVTSPSSGLIKGSRNIDKCQMSTLKCPTVRCRIKNVGILFSFVRKYAFVGAILYLT